jgi:hypothetical protein
MNVPIVILDSATKLPVEADGGVVVTGSHGAVYAAHLTAKSGARAAIHHDAGIGLHDAGIGGLAYAQKLGMAMAAVAAASARIGDAQDLYDRGVISRANPLATACGVAAGMTVKEAVERLKAAPWPHQVPSPKEEGRYLVDGVVCIDSTSLLRAEDGGRIVASGSHGGTNSGTTAAPLRPRLIILNDAGPGAGRGGILGLHVLQREGLAAAAVAAASARIGDGRSTLQDGTISAVNDVATRLGARVGMPALALAGALAEKSS